MQTPNIASLESASKAGLQYKYLLDSAPESPLIFLVHGRAGNYDVMWTFKRCVPQGWNIIAPQAPLPDPIGGFSWWQIIGGIPKSETKENAQRAAVQLGSFIESVIKQHGLKPKFIVAAGFSQGAGVLTALIQKQPELMRALAVLAGFALRLYDKSEDFAQKNGLPAIFWAHGEKDEMVPLERAKSGQEYLKGLGFKIDSVVDPVGHKVGTDGMRALTAWLSSIT